MSLVDISRSVSEETSPWPGDVPFRHEWTARIGEESNVTLGAFCMSAHLGTHADAPFHFDPDGARSEAFPLDAFCGPAHVVRVEDTAARPAHVRGLDLAEASRVLFKTRASEQPSSEWSDDFPPIRPETIERLAERGAVLIGTDAPSVDPASSAELPAHHTLSRHGVYNLENLDLGGVEPGRYELIALPLKLQGMDAAPVRAALRPRE